MHGPDARALAFGRNFLRNISFPSVYCLHIVLCYRFISAKLIAMFLVTAQLTLSLAWLGHEALEAREDARIDAAIASGKAPAAPAEHHDESRCHVCQAVAAVRGHMLSPPAPFAVQILQRPHESTAISIVASRSAPAYTLAHPRGPPIV